MGLKNKKVLISVAVIIASIAVVYFLDFSKWKEIDSIDGQISQVESSIAAKKSYYAVIDNKIQALHDAGWSDKKGSIAINFDSSIFFKAKINDFFKNIVSTSGMTLSGMTSSSPETVKSQVQATTQTENGTKISKTTTETVQASSNYFNQLQGDVKKTTINLNITGTYSAFKNLLSQFEGQTRIITIKSVVVSPSVQETSKTGTKNNLSFTVALDVYSY